MTQLHYHEAARADSPAITAIYNKAVLAGGSTADTVVQTVAERERWIAAHHAPYSAFLIELEDDRGTRHPVAFASISAFYARPGYDGVCTLAYYVDADWQRQGIGTFVIRMLLDECRARGMRKACTTIFADNIGSISLMERNSFIRYGLLPDAAYDSKGTLHAVSYWTHDIDGNPLG